MESNSSYRWRPCYRSHAPSIQQVTNLAKTLWREPKLVKIQRTHWQKDQVSPLVPRRKKLRRVSRVGAKFSLEISCEKRPPSRWPSGLHHSFEKKSTPPLGNFYFALMMITESICPCPSSSVVELVGSSRPTPSTKNL